MRGKIKPIGTAEAVRSCLPSGSGIAFCTPVLSLLSRMEALAALFTVAVQRVEDHGIRFPGGKDLVHFDGLTLELFVILKKPAQHDQAMRRHLRRLVISVELRILRRDRNNFMIL